MPVPSRLFLIGYRGSGKSTVARQLALVLGYDWVDADVEVELAAGKSIAAIFSDDGEAAFRDLEETVVARLCQGERLVAALGGGALLRPATRERITQAGTVVWLVASPDTLAQRIDADATSGQRRPRLTDQGGRAEVEAVLAERTPIYRAAAQLIVDTENKAPTEIAAEIAAQLEKRGA